MKQTLLTRLVLGAIAGIAVAGAANAGQIQASSVSIAREVITTDTQAVVSPSIAYRFAGDVDARQQTQVFQVQFTLAAGTWAVAPTASAFSVSDGVSGVIINQQAATDGAYSVTSVGMSTDKKTVFATIQVLNSAAGVLIKQPLISVNVSTNTINGVAATATAAARGTINGLKTVAGDLVDDFTNNALCQNVKTLAVSFKHYVALTSPGILATDENATPDEHTRGGHTDTATLITFPTNLLVNVGAATGSVSLSPGGNTSFVLGSAGTAYISATKALLGSVTMSQNNTNGYDSNLINNYLLAGGGAGVLANATAAGNAGRVEAKDLKVTVSATQGFVVGGSVYLATDALGATPVGGTATVPVTAANAAGPIDLIVPTAALNATLGAATGIAPVYVIYQNPGAVTIPSSQFSAVGRLEKAAAGVDLNEQDNICKGNFISLGGGLKIDVRNYASSKETSGYQSVIRLINPSETRTADVWGQIIHQNGQYGGYGLLTTLAPRQVLNMTAAQIDAKLTNAPATPTAAINGATAPVAAAAGAPRLRITSQSGDTLRVQNYMFNSATGQILEASGDQAVDFAVPNTNRAPANDGQYISQDAQAGLNAAP